MKSKVIRVRGVTEAALLAAAAKEVTTGDVIIYRGKFAVDGKSVLGVLSLDMSDGVKIEYPSDAIEFEKFLEQYEVK